MNCAASNPGRLACFVLVLGAASWASAQETGGPAGAPTPENLRAMVGQPVDGHPALRWKYAEIEVEWGFQEGTEKLAFDGSIACTQTGMVGKGRPLPGDKATTMAGDRAWKSPGSGTSRRGIVMPALYTAAVRGPGRTILTVRTSAGSFSFQPVDLEGGPILAPEYGFFVRDISPPAPPPPQKAPPPQQASQVAPPKDLLTAKMDSREGSSSARGWGSKDTPCIYANADLEAGVFLGGAIRVPPCSVAAHPGADRDVAVGWRSPLAGKVGVKAKVADAHARGGNGVEWSIVHDAKPGRKVLARGAIGQGGSQAIPPAADAAKLAAVTVEPGDVLSLVVGNNGSHQCDTTSIELTIAEIGGKGRTWGLADDVVDDMQAGNPHADSLGNAAVWYFYAPARPQARGVSWRPPVVAFESKATTAREYIAELAARKPRTIRQRVREHPEQTWEGAMEALHGKREWPAFPKVPYEPKMTVEVPCQYLTGLWRIGAWQIIKRCPRIHRDDIGKVGAAGDVRGDCRRVGPDDPNGVYVVRDNPFPPLGCETDRILWALDHMGMHDAARDGMTIWLANQNEDGSLSLHSGIERAHKVGALQLPWVMAEHYRLTGDKEWLRRQLPRLKAAAEWIINRRRTTMKETLSQAERDGIKAGTWSPYGLQPKVSMGDGDPSGSRYYYWADSAGYQSVKLLAEVVGDVDAKAAAELKAEAEAYRKDFLPVLNESIVLSPVMKVRDGTCRSFVPQGFQDRGPLARALPEGANLFRHCGPYHADYVITSAAIEAWIRSGLLSADDKRIDGHFEVLEDVFLLDHPWFRRRKGDYDPARDWFGFGWAYQSGWERLPEFYLVADDVANFLRSWLNRCAVDLNLGNWTFNEHTTFAANDKSHGNSVFLSNFRNMLVMEIGETLWLARATPRAWLEAGKKITVKNAPTHFGAVSYEIVSDADNGKITATVEMPSRQVPKAVLLRLRHPKAAPIRSVTVNGKDWKDFDRKKETVRLVAVRDAVKVQATY